MSFSSRVTRRVCEKSSQNVAQPIFVNINALDQPWNKVARKCWILLIFQVTAKSKQPPIRPIWPPCFQATYMSVISSNTRIVYDRESRVDRKACYL
jgi:hypothetical protein